MFAKSWTVRIKTVLKRLSDRFNAILLSWDPTDRTVLISLLIAAEFAMYLAWALVVTGADVFHTYVDVALVKQIIKLDMLVISSFLGFAFLLRFVRKHVEFINMVQLIMIALYMSALFIMGYSIGYTSMMTGVALIGTSVLGLMLLDRLLIYVSLLFSSVVLFGLFYAVSQGYLAEAPAILSGQETSGFWMLSYLYFVMPKVGAIFLMVDRLMHNLQTNHDQLDYLSNHDALTGLLNRRSINAYTLKMMRSHKGLAIILLDLDFFKDVNDTFGHQAGDKVLVEVARRLTAVTRRYDRVSRYGGEEYLMILPRTTEEDAYHIAERLRQDIEALGFEVMPEQEIHLTASFGVAALEDDVALTLAKHDSEAEKLFTRLFEQADKALYSAKESGRNQVKRALSRVY